MPSKLTASRRQRQLACAQGASYPILGYASFLAPHGVMEKSIYSAEYRRLYELLRQLREDAGVRQVDLAEQLGVPQSFISKYESGERRLDVIETSAIARALGTTLADVVRRLEKSAT